MNSAPSSRASVELLVVDVDGDDAPAGDRGVLDREVAEAADAEHRGEIARAGARDLDRLVGRDARAGQRRGVEGVDAGGDLDDVARVGGRVLAERAVERVAHVLLLEAERLPARHAVVAGAAGVAEPRHRDAVAERDLGDAGAELDDDADALVAGDERRRRLDRPVAVGGVDVGVAQARRLDLDADLPGGEVQRAAPSRRSAGRGTRARRRRGSSARPGSDGCSCASVASCWWVVVDMRDLLWSGPTQDHGAARPPP